MKPCRLFGGPLAVSALAANLAVGCGGEPSGPSACEQVNEQRLLCELDPLDCLDERQACEAQCTAYLSCEELGAPFEDPGAAACLWHCVPRFRCDDGREIYILWQCDGEADCAGGEDEVQCDN